MNAFSIVATAVGTLLIVWLIWVTGRPVTRPLLPDDSEKELLSGVPSAAQEASEGNILTPFTSFDSFTASMKEDIRSAAGSIHMEFFKYEDDPMSREIAALLADKVSEGVEVRLLVDGAVNGSRRKLYRKMRAAGIQVQLFDPMHFPLPFKRDNYRNHRKIVVVDGRVAYVGGMNIAERYGKGLDWGCWRDTQLRIDGPAASSCQLAFARDWARCSGEMLGGPRYFPPLRPHSGGARAALLCSGPNGDGPLEMELICRTLLSARKRFWIESPYLIPTPEIRQALCDAARRGVDVRVIIPPRGDRGVLPPLASNANVEPLLRAGVKIASYRDGYMHSKTWVCDGKLASVGSTNIDPRSYRLDLEADVAVEDDAFAARMEEIFLHDEARSDYFSLESWLRRPFTHKAAEAFAKLFSAQL